MTEPRDPRRSRATRVVAYAGGRGEEEPRALEIDGRRVAIREVVRRWRDPEGRWFDVVDERGEPHRLLCSEPALTWSSVAPSP